MTATTEDPSATVQGEVRMLIDGELVEGRSGRAVRQHQPGHRGGAGSGGRRRRRGHGSRHRRGPQGVRRDGLVHRSGASASAASASSTTPSSASRSCSAPSWWPRSAARSPSPTGRSSTRRWRTACSGRPQTIDDFEWERDLPIGEAFGMRSWRKVVKEPAGVVGAIIPWNYPFEVTLQKLGQALATGNTMIVKPAPDTPWNATRIGRLIAEQTDIPAGVVNVRDHVGQRGRRAARRRPPRRPDLVHRLDRGRSPHHGDGRADHEAVLPRARRQVGPHRPRRRRPGLGRRSAPPSSASTPARAAPC